MVKFNEYRVLKVSGIMIYLFNGFLPGQMILNIKKEICIQSVV